MSKTMASLGFGVLTGVALALLLMRLRERSGDDLEGLADSISERLDILEEQFRATGRFQDSSRIGA
ncbi:MAG: hypothetical protein KIT11_02635 [Fimbriimonadaceae bacterium]|nr:hypothetical protein [Fimbriimonadaceae bacterium]QYK54736.1 MAG: hypothetical protein KF733_06900 [Fimbriimonadaceae bacterium]